ncbi:MAG TPA: hypothetical protein EYN34_01325 [Aquifex sp.]|nr:hypothetical protein [Aquifex sp.]
MKDPKWILREVKTHLALVEYERERIEERGLSPDLLEDRDFLILLDAFIFRFIKLQSALGEKLFPLLFEILTGRDRTEVTFIDILNTLEKYGIIPSAEYWKKLRKLRNEFVHLYPWETELKLEAVKRALEEVDTLEGIVKKIEKILK